MNYKPVRAIERAAEILNCFDIENSRLTVNDISRMIKLPKSTIARIIYTMAELGLLRRDEKDKSYYLGPKLYRLGFFAKKNISIVEIAAPYMKEIRDRTQEAVTLYVKEDDCRVSYEHIESLRMMSCLVKLGDKYPLWAGASGKCILAYCKDESFILEQLKRAYPVTPNTIVDQEAFFKELEGIREKGYAISYGEREVGVLSVGVPIFESNGTVNACLSVAGPSTRFTEKEIEKLVPDLKNITKIISENLGQG